MKTHNKIILSLCLAGAALGLSGAASAQPGVMRLVVPFAPGGGADNVARVIGKRLQQELGETVIVENKPGAGGNIAAEQVAQGPGDGKMLMLATNSLVINPLIYPNVRFDARKSFAPVAMLGRSPLVIVVGADSPFKTLRELLEAGKRDPKRLSYATCGNGSIHHIAGEQLKLLAGVQMQHIPYKGCAPAMTDVAGGQVHLGVISLTTAAPFIAGNKARALAVTSDEPSPLIPNVPAAAKEGVASYRFDGWYALLASSKTPKPVVERLNAAVNRSLADDEVKRAMAAGQMEPVAVTPETLAQFIDKEIAVYQPIVQTASIKGD